MSSEPDLQNKAKRVIAASPQRRPLGHAPSRSDKPSHSGKPAVGRYDGRSHNTRLIGLGTMPSSANTRDAAVVAAVEDPWGDGKQRVYATVNRRVDVLENERSHKLISEGAYRVGRQVQQVFELASRVGGSNWGGDSRSDPLHAQRGAIARKIERAEEILAMEARISRRLGAIDTRLLARVLRDRMSFADCAALVGKSGAWGERFIKARFRDALEDLAEAWTAKGATKPTPDDKHAAAAATVAERQPPRAAPADRPQADTTPAAACKTGAAAARRAPGARGR